jgi:hypothetical protein
MASRRAAVLSRCTPRGGQLFVPLGAAKATTPEQIFAGRLAVLVTALGMLRTRRAKAWQASRALLPQLPAAHAGIPAGRACAGYLARWSSPVTTRSRRRGGSAMAASVGAVAGGASVVTGDAG